MIAPSPAAAAGAVLFEYTGAPQRWTVPTDVTSIQIDAYGARGAGIYPGFGGRTTATLAVTPGQVLEVRAGGEGVGGTAGYNGGGTRGWGGSGLAGGGASDVRGSTFSLGERLVVAGGGGGSPTGVTSYAGQGGAGGGVVGQDGANGTGCFTGGKGGSQTSGGGLQVGWGRKLRPGW
ncbi:MAG: glycine-rich protein [Acidimicrobiales bacterium]